MEGCWILFIWCIIGAICFVHANYSPVLNWDVCSPSRIVVTLSNAQEGGIIYIRGYGAACRQMTSSNTTQHVFDFQACGIVTGETYFTIIVQKNPLYQTGADLQESLLCIYDLSDISVGNNVNVGDKNDDAGINKTTKPTGSMILYKDGIDIGGQNVQLSDIVTMTIQLDEEFRDDFDIKVLSCTANFIDIIQNYCAVDTALFPDFQHVSQAVVTSTFGAFRTTDLGGGYVQMIYSCTVQVCLGPCSAETCTDGAQGWGRKRKRRSVDDVTYDEISIGASFSVGTDQDKQVTENDSMDHFCIDNTAFILLILTIVGVLVMSLSLTIHVTTKLLKRNDELRNLTGINSRQRKSLVEVVKERRRSSALLTQRNYFNQAKCNIGSDLHNSNAMEKSASGSPESNNGLQSPSGKGTAIVNGNKIVDDKCCGKLQTGKTLDKKPVDDDKIKEQPTTNDNINIVPVTCKALDVNFETLFGFSANHWEAMTDEQKRKRINDCKSLLNRLSTLQRPIQS